MRYCGRAGRGLVDCWMRCFCEALGSSSRRTQPPSCVGAEEGELRKVKEEKGAAGGSNRRTRKSVAIHQQGVAELVVHESPTLSGCSRITFGLVSLHLFYFILLLVP